MMNRKIILQIIEEAKEIPEDEFNMAWWHGTVDGKTQVDLIGNYINNHPELRDVLQIQNRYDPLPKTVGSMTKHLEVDIQSLATYLNLNYEETDVLFIGHSNQTKQEVVNKILAFINGEFVIRECHECNHSYETDKEDRAIVCPDCKEDLLERCGL